MKAICVTTSGRTDRMTACMKSIESNPGFRDWHLYISREPAAGIKYVPPMPVKVCVAAFQYGPTLNTFMAYQAAFHDKAEAVLYLDDDMIVSPDALQLCDWYLDTYAHEPIGLPEDVGLCLCREDETNDPSKPEVVSQKDTWMGLVGQGYFVTGSQWHNFVKRRFWTHEPHYGGDDYDWALGHSAVDLGKRVLRPRLSRSQHTGIVGAHAGRIFPQIISQQTDTKFIIEAI